MLKPRSIVTFERCYIGAWALGLVNTLLAWPRAAQMLADNPSVQQLGPNFAPTMMVLGVALGALVTFLLWYFVARRGSAVAKWIVVVFFAIGVVSFLTGLASGSTAAAGGITLAIGLVALVLQGIAVVMLFRPDAIAWFNHVPDEPLA